MCACAEIYLTGMRIHRCSIESTRDKATISNDERITNKFSCSIFPLPGSRNCSSKNSMQYWRFQYISGAPSTNKSDTELLSACNKSSPGWLLFVHSLKLYFSGFGSLFYGLNRIVELRAEL